MREVRPYLRKAVRASRRSLAWVRDNVPWGLRTLLGMVLIVGGVFGFLPVLGFWMIPFGIAFVLFDIRDLVRTIRSYLMRR